MFSRHPDVDKFPHYGDRENYFPTSTQMGSIDYGKIVVDPTKRDDEMQVVNIEVDYNILEI